jgi:GT2 family glycosyltransferase
MALAVPPDGGPSTAPSSDVAPARLARPSRSASTRVPELSVVIVNFCQWRNTARLARQLRRSLAVRSGHAEIVIVDNHSPFHPVVRRLKRLGGITIRGFSRNHGFARAVNRGCGLGKGQWILLLNPDVTVEDGFLDDVLATIDRLEANDPRAGVVGFRLRNADGSGQASAGPFPTLANTLSGVLRPRSRRKCRHQPGEAREPVPWVTGGCLLVRRDCFTRLGGLDESFFLYYEDVDFCRRAADAGWSVWYDPELQVTHHWPLHARRVPAPLRLMTRHALLTYARKHWPRWQAGGLAALLWAEAGLKQTWAAVRGDRDSARCYGELRRLVQDVSQGRTAEIRRRIRTVAAFLDPIAAEQDGRTS